MKTKNWYSAGLSKFQERINLRQPMATGVDIELRDVAFHIEIGVSDSALVNIWILNQRLSEWRPCD